MNDPGRSGDEQTVEHELRAPVQRQRHGIVVERQEVRLADRPGRQPVRSQVARRAGTALIFSTNIGNHIVETRSWEHFEHEADIGLAATSDERESLFEAMAEALTAVITDPASVQTEDRVRIRCRAPDNALLMVDWINALVYEMATRRMLFGAWHVSLQGCELDAWAEGESVDRDRHQPVVEVKGATYTELLVGQDEAGLWHARCVVDV